MIGIISGLISMLGWGTSDFLAAKSSRKIGSVLTFFWTQIFSFFIGSIYFFVKFKTLDINNTPRFLIFLLPAEFLYMGATLVFYKGFAEGQVSLVSAIGGSWVIITVILSVIFFNEILKINQIIGIIMIILGVPLLSINLRELIKIKKLNLFKGTKEGLIAMLGWGFSLFLIIPASKTLGWFLPIFITRVFAVVFLASYIFFSKRSFRINFQSSILILLLLIGLLDMTASFAYSFGVRSEYASIVAPIAAAFPLVTIVLARIFLKERLALNQVLGIVSVIIGLILVSI